MDCLEVNNSIRTLSGGTGDDTFYISQPADNESITIITDFRKYGTTTVGDKEETDNDILVLPESWSGTVNVCQQTSTGISICDKETGKVLAEISGNITQDLIDGIDTGKGDIDEQLIVFGKIKNGN